MAADGSRKLRVVISTAGGAASALLLAALVPAASDCSSDVEVGNHDGGTGGSSSGTGATGATGASSSSGLGGFTTSSGTGGQGGAGVCPDYQMETSFTVDVPPQGVPASLGQICAVSTTPVDSNTSARVTLTKYSQALNMANGFVAVPPAVLSEVVGLPTISVVDAWVPELQTMVVSQITPQSGGFSFHADWPLPFDVLPESYTRMTVQASFDIKCDPGGNTTKTVQAITYVHLCLENGDVDWVSSGDLCTACDTVCEMAPSPLVQSRRPGAEPDDGLPLGRALRLRIVPLVTTERAMVLLAEHDGGSTARYRWEPTGGDVTEIAPDVVVWTLPAGGGPHAMQVAVERGDAAAVASHAAARAA